MTHKFTMCEEEPIFKIKPVINYALIILSYDILLVTTIYYSSVLSVLGYLVFGNINKLIKNN
jgi:hypothetical protein